MKFAGCLSSLVTGGKTEISRVVSSRDLERWEVLSREGMGKEEVGRNGRELEKEVKGEVSWKKE